MSESRERPIRFQRGGWRDMDEMGRPSRSRARWAPALVLLALALASPAPAELRVYDVRHRTAEELLPVARTALAGEGSAAVDVHTNALVLSGPGAAIERTLDLLRTLDRRLRTVVLHYVSVGREEIDAAAVRVDWNAAIGSARIGTVAPAPNGSRLAVSLAEHRHSDTPRFAGTLRILEGRRGRLSTGEEFPLRARVGADETILFANAQSGFEVRPRIRADGRVQLELFAFEGGFPSDSLAAATQVDLEPGRSLVIGRLARGDRTHERRRLVGSAARSERDERLLVVTVEVE